MVPPANRTHYDVLGVVRGASAGEVRRAYLDLARVFHPDRWVDAGPKANVEAERRMREVNVAWDVLGDAGRRRSYDRELDRAAGARDLDADMDRFANRTDGTVEDLTDIGAGDPAARFIRGLPWVLLLLILAAIFVFTAFARSGGSGSSPDDPGGLTGACITVDRESSVDRATCGSRTRVVVREINPSASCPPGTERLQPTNIGAALCLEP